MCAREERNICLGNFLLPLSGEWGKEEEEEVATAKGEGVLILGFIQYGLGKIN